MAFSYLSHGHFARDDGEPFGDRFLYYYDPRVDDRLDRPSERFRKVDPALDPDNLLVVRGSYERFVADLEADVILPEIVDETPVLGLSGSFDKANREPRLWTPSWSKPPTFKVDLEELRQVEIRSILEASGAVFAKEGHHFQLPSGLHADRFVRLAEALYDSTDVSRIVDWLLPHVTANSAVVSDTGSMLALLFALRAEALRRFEWDIPISALVEYPTDAEAVRRLLAEASQSGGRTIDRLLVVVSVSSSGRTVDLIAQHAEIDYQVVTICDTSDNTAARAGESRTSFAVIPVQRWPVEGGKCPRCDDLDLLRIHPQSYEVRHDLRFKQRKLRLRREDFWRIAERQHAVSLHYEMVGANGQEARRDHYGIYIDVEQLLGDRKFRERCVDQLRGLPAIDAVLIPAHRKSVAIEALVAEALPQVADNTHVVPASGFAAALPARVLEAERVLIIDDAMVTGATLLGMRRELYQVTKACGRSPEVHALVLILRPPDNSVEAKIRRTFGFVEHESPGLIEQGRVLALGLIDWLSSQLHLPGPIARPLVPAQPVRFFLHHVEKVYLPDECPWCIERTALRGVLDELSDVAGSRTAALERLGQLDRNRLEDPILLDHDCAIGLTEGSAIGDLGSIAAFASAASQAQRHRLDLGESELRNEITFSDARFFIEAHYDSVILSGYLRTCSRRQLRGPDADAAVDALIEQTGRQLGKGCLIELGWAAILAKLPPRGVRQALLAMDERDATVTLTLEALDALYPGSRGSAVEATTAHATSATSPE